MGLPGGTCPHCVSIHFNGWIFWNTLHQSTLLLSEHSWKILVIDPQQLGTHSPGHLLLMAPKTSDLVHSSPQAEVFVLLAPCMAPCTQGAGYHLPVLYCLSSLALQCHVCRWWTQVYIPVQRWKTPTKCPHVWPSAHSSCVPTFYAVSNEKKKKRNLLYNVKGLCSVCGSSWDLCCMFLEWWLYVFTVCKSYAVRCCVNLTDSLVRIFNLWL